MDNDTEGLLAYLHHHLPSYPFDAEMDSAFVKELVDDFPGVDILEETKAFRWYYDNDPVSKMKQVRVGLRRWILRSTRPRRQF